MIDVKKAVTGYVIATTFFASTSYSFLKITPTNYWMRYDLLDFIEPVITGQDAKVISYSHWVHPVDIRGIVTLYCAPQIGPFEYAGQTTTTQDKFYPETYTQVLRVVRIPEWAVKCYVENTVTLMLDFGIRKTKRMKSPIRKVIRP